MQTTPNNSQGNIRKITPDGPLSSAGVVITDVTPRVTEWIPTLLTDLIPVSTRAVRRYIADNHPEVLTHKRYSQIASHLQQITLGVEDETWRETTNLWSDDEAEAAEYVDSLVELAVKYYEEDEVENLASYHCQWYEHLETRVTEIGTGRGALNASLGALAKGPVQLHRKLNGGPYPITLILDGDSWSNLEDRGTGVRALAAIAVLGSAFDVRLVISPALESMIKRRYPAWYDAHLGLTETSDTSITASTGENMRDEQQQEKAWNALQQLPEQSGKLRLLGNLPVGQAREYRDLKQDDEIDVREGTFGRYILELEELGLVDIDRREEYNTASLTGVGKIAVEQYVTDDYGLIHPAQSTLETRLTPTPQRQASTVYPARKNTRGGESPQTADEWLAATGDPDADNDYVQWLSGPSGVLDAWGMHQRYLSGRQTRGISLVDDQIKRFDDGRVTYLSCFEDDLLVAAQWGGPLATLGRLAGTLLSDKALNKILTPSRLGNRFEEINNAVVEQLDKTAGDIIRWGHQIGWFSEDEETYDGWRERIGSVRTLCLQQLGKLVDSDDVEDRSKFIRKLQGLIASATQLYYAAGIDVTINIRVPDTAMLISDEKRLNDFLDFAQYTVPKQSVYGIHSGYRMLLEERPAKLKQRLSYEVGDDDPTMHLTSSWVFSGPTITGLQPDIERAINREAEDLREAVAEGNETAPIMEIPVRISNSYSALRELVEEFASEKGYQVSHSGDITAEKHDLQRLVRLFLRTLGSEDQPHRASPYDVAEAMLHIASSTRSYDFITTQDISYGLSQLPCTRLLPDLPPTATKILKTLLDADDPMGRSDIVETAGISGSSYDRYINELAAWDVIEPRKIEGRRRWEAHLEPWWTPQSTQDEPFADPNPDTGIFYNELPRDVVHPVMCHLTTHYDLPDLMEAYVTGIQPGDDLKALFGKHKRLHRWWAFLWGAYADEHDLQQGPSSNSIESDVAIVRIGSPMDTTDASQASLSKTVSPPLSTSSATRSD